MCCCGFVCVVVEVVLGGFDEVGDGGDEEDGGRLFWFVFGVGLKEGEESGCYEVLSSDVGVVDLILVIVGNFWVVEEVSFYFVCVVIVFCCKGSGGYVGVVDENVECFFVWGDFVVEGFDVIFGGDVWRDGDDGIGDVFVVGFNNGVEFWFGVFGDVDFVVIDGEGLSCYEINVRVIIFIFVSCMFYDRNGVG